LRLGTGVTAPIIRMHPAVVAHAAATVATLMPGRFMLGVGTGENLNEHIVGAGWPPIKIRRAMLSEAIDVIRKLWAGKQVTYFGDHHRVEEAQLFDLPDPLPEILVAAAGKRSATLAGKEGDGLISVFPDSKILTAFDEAGGAGKPKYIKLTVCYDEDEIQARRIVHEYWPLDALRGRLATELKTPKDFESASSFATREQAADKVLCGGDAESHAKRIQELVSQGFDRVYVHQIGPNQEEFFQFYEAEVLPRVAEVS
jgi:G6PDH family F420-dependent oxidoreductase